jgi:hypothetical protein
MRDEAKQEPSCFIPPSWLISKQAKPARNVSRASQFSDNRVVEISYYFIELDLTCPYWLPSEAEAVLSGDRA